MLTALLADTELKVLGHHRHLKVDLVAVVLPGLIQMVTLHMSDVAVVLVTLAGAVVHLMELLVGTLVAVVAHILIQMHKV